MNDNSCLYFGSNLMFAFYICILVLLKSDNMILEKELINRKRSLEELFAESELWHEVYNIYWAIAPMRNRNKAITMMHDIRYICVCINWDKEPDKYLSATGFDSYVKRAMAYVVFKGMNNLTQKVCAFLPTMYTFLSKWDKFRLVEEALEKMLAKGNSYSVDLMPQPELPKRIHFDYCKWSKLTNDFEKDAIIEVLSLWQHKEDRIEILKKMERTFKSHSKENAWFRFYMKDRESALRNRFLELHGQLEGDNFLVEEIKRLYEENKRQKEKIRSLEGEKREDWELMIVKHSGVKEGMKTIVEQLLKYGEHFTSEQNAKAEVIKGAIMSLIFNKHIPDDILSNEQRVRLNNLGNKEQGISLNAESMFKITGNDQVNIGGNNG